MVRADLSRSRRRGGSSTGSSRSLGRWRVVRHMSLCGNVRCLVARGRRCIPHPYTAHSGRCRTTSNVPARPLAELRQGSRPRMPMRALAHRESRFRPNALMPPHPISLSNGHQTEGAAAPAPPIRVTLTRRTAPQPPRSKATRRPHSPQYRWAATPDHPRCAASQKRDAQPYNIRALPFRFSWGSWLSRTTVVCPQSVFGSLLVANRPRGNPLEATRPLALCQSPFAGCHALRFWNRGPNSSALKARRVLERAEFRTRFGVGGGRRQQDDRDTGRSNK
jgi:hypothetical protein